MELLLALLSLLTAATGAVAGVRVPEAGVHQSVGIAAVAPARQAVLHRAAAPAHEQARVVDEAMPAASAQAPSTAPLYANRRRE